MADLTYCSEALSKTAGPESSPGDALDLQTPPDSAVASTNLTGIPSELRLLIYSIIEAIDPPVSVKITDSYAYRSEEDKLPALASLAFTCKDLYNEIRPTLYKSTNFRLDVSNTYTNIVGSTRVLDNTLPWLDRVENLQFYILVEGFNRDPAVHNFRLGETISRLQHLINRLTRSTRLKMFGFSFHPQQSKCFVTDRSLDRLRKNLLADSEWAAKSKKDLELYCVRSVVGSMHRLRDLRTR